MAHCGCADTDIVPRRCDRKKQAENQAKDYSAVGMPPRENAPRPCEGKAQSLTTGLRYGRRVRDDSLTTKARVRGAVWA